MDGEMISSIRWFTMPEFCLQDETRWPSQIGTAGASTRYSKNSIGFYKSIFTLKSLDLN